MRPGLTVNGDHLSRFSLYVNAIRANVGVNTATAFRTVTGYLVADRLERDIALTAEIESMARDGKYAIEWEALLNAAAGHWGEFFEALVERSPDDPRINDLKRLPGAQDAPKALPSARELEDLLDATEPKSDASESPDGEAADGERGAGSQAA
jgi:hypothetical protein